MHILLKVLHYIKSVFIFQMHALFLNYCYYSPCNYPCNRCYCWKIL